MPKRHRLKPDPLGEPRNPFQVYLLALATISGVAQLIGQTTTRSVESELPYTSQVAWAIMLVIGSTTALAGMYWQGDRRTGLVLKRLGFVSLASASIIYGTILLVGFGLGASLVALTVYGFAAVCCERAWQVHRYIRGQIRAHRA